MKTLLILGAGTAGTMVANKLSHELDPEEWQIVIVDQDETHYYQPGFLFIPFGIYGPRDVIKPKRNYIPSNVKLIVSEIEVIEPDKNRVRIVKDGRWLSYDYLVIATGTHPRPEETPGLVNGHWRDTIHDFYTYEGALALARSLRHWESGRLVMNDLRDAAARRFHQAEGDGSTQRDPPGEKHQPGHRFLCRGCRFGDEDAHLLR